MRLLLKAAFGLCVLPWIMAAGPAWPQKLDAAGTGLPSLSPVLEKVLPSVVSIAVKGRAPAPEAEDEPKDPALRRYFGLPDALPERDFQAAGSGVIIDARKGLVVTNYHVVSQANEITIVFNDGTALPAKRVGSDPDTDIAVLKVDSSKSLTSLPFGNSDALKVGDYVVAVGNPFGLRQTATLGIVSALARSGLGIEGLESFIQTDAPINPGNSGGALVNLRGELVGINTAILGPSGGSVGIGFAIPSSMVRHIVEQIVHGGLVRRGRIGIALQDLTPKLAKVFGARAEQGVIVTQVVPGSPAAVADLHIGDVILAVDGRAIRGSDQLRSLVSLLPAGRTLSLSVVRDKKTLKMPVTVAAALPRLVPAPVGSVLEGAVFGQPDDKPAGVQDLPGVKIVEVRSQSPAALAGLMADDVIIGVGDTVTLTPEELIKAMKSRRRSDGTLLFIVRDGVRMFLVAG